MALLGISACPAWHCLGSLLSMVWHCLVLLCVWDCLAMVEIAWPCVALPNTVLDRDPWHCSALPSIA
eukprot:8096326-Pyramimonas_sp.AAC.1